MFLSLSLGEQEFTKSNKRKRASYKTAAEWVLEAWNEVDTKMIRDSFPGCGFGLTRDINEYHSRLKEFLDGKEPATDNSETTGLTDDEEDDDFTPHE